MEKGARGAVMGKPTKPFWMRLHVAEFIADTANMTAIQGWAYIQLLLAMWRSDDGTLPHDADTLAHIGKVPRYRWEKVWAAIGRFFDVDGDRVTPSSRAWQGQCADNYEASRRANRGKDHPISPGQRTTDAHNNTAQPIEI
jgi:uncharacterized protein YdaU (DUF1376 family)